MHEVMFGSKQCRRETSDGSPPGFPAQLLWAASGIIVLEAGGVKVRAIPLTGLSLSMDPRHLGSTKLMHMDSTSASPHQYSRGV